MSATEMRNAGNGRWVNRSSKAFQWWMDGAVRARRIGLDGMRERIHAATAKPIDLFEGKRWAGPRAARPLPEHARRPRRPVETPF